METLQSENSTQNQNQPSLGTRTVSHVTGIGLHTRLYTNSIAEEGESSIHGQLQEKSLSRVETILAEGELRDTQLRLLRFVWIELNRLCVELGSFPVFSSLLPQLSLHELKNALRYIREAGTKFTQPVDARLISEMQDIQKKNKYIEFQQDFSSFREVRKIFLQAIGSFPDESSFDVLEKNSSESSESSKAIYDSLKDQFEREWKVLNNYSAVTHRLVQLNECVDALMGSGFFDVSEYLNLETVAALQFERQIVREKFEAITAFFAYLEKQLLLPKIQNSEEAFQWVHAIHCLQTTPKRILQNRVVSVLNLNEKIRIDIWKDRAKPILEQKLRLSKCFKLSSPVKCEDLEKLADQISSLSFLDRFKSHYSEIMGRYEVLLVQDDTKEFKRLLSLSHFEKAQALRDWSQWLKSSQSFIQNAEARGIFGSLFKGIDTDFELVKDVYHWGQLMQIEMPQSKTSPFASELRKFIFTSSYEILEELLRICSSENEKTSLNAGDLLSFSSLEEYLSENIGHSNRVNEGEVVYFETNLQKIQNEEKLLGRAQDILKQLQFGKDLKASDLKKLKENIEDLQFLFVRIYQNAGVFKAKLDQAFSEKFEKSNLAELGILTQLKVALEYVYWLENSLLPDDLKRIFSFGNGYSKLMETVSRADFFLHLLRKVENQVELFLQASSQRGGKASEVFENRPAQVLLNEMQEILQIR